jgi:hypothetical protein
MPKIECWGNLPEGVRQHLIDRMRDRAISIADAQSTPCLDFYDKLHSLRDVLWGTTDPNSALTTSESRVRKVATTLAPHD